MNSQQSRNFVGKKIDDFILVDVLGTGAFGQVFSAQNIITKESVAIKSVPKTKLREHNGLVGQLLKTEVQVLAQCNNINVVKMNKYLESENNCYLVMEYCNQGDLEQLWKKKNRIISEEDAIQYIKQILNGMRGLHEMNVIHRDLKLANILISNSVLKIGDLGFAKRLESLDGVVKEALGTLGTMAPEIIQFQPYGILADMFSIGAIYYQLLFGVLPFSIKSYNDFLNDVRTNKPNFTRNNVKISKESEELLIRMLNPDPNQRLQWKQLYESPLFSNQVNKSALSKLTVDKVVATQVDLKMIKQVYEKNQQKFDNINNQNMIKKLQSDVPKLEHKQVMDNSNDEQLLQEALKQKQLQQQKTNDLNNVFEKYLNERNTLVFLGTVLHEIHQRKHTQNTNVFLPAFIISKKLIIEMNRFLDVLKKQINIYQCAYFFELYTFPQFIAFIKLCEEDYQNQMAHFHVIQLQLQTILFQMQNQANEKYISELQPAPTSQFDENYRDILINYYMQLQDEKGENENQDNSINNLSIYVLDTILFDREIKKQFLNQKVDDYFEKFNFLTNKEKEEIIALKFQHIYSF
ncbi:unnamed protein product [Paramecium sonneborni]|uniref:Protein kinase domain-containing protein n=1 Tax=Paramecium sonneborni TaxID=65129 RepID=A0A8S1M800_9CILI|nr:unnamed protein product [Paramecium sonneborni]